MIKITIAVHAKNHIFRLAEGLNREGILDKIYTIYPKFKLKEYDIPKRKIKSFWILGAIKYLGRILKVRIIEDFATEFFDGWVARNLTKPLLCDKWIFNSCSGYCEQSLIRAKKLGGIACVERACPHIDFQLSLVNGEKERLLGKPEPKVNNPVWERMKREYEIADYIITPSSYSQRSFLERGFSRDKILIIPLCNEKKIVRRDVDREFKPFTILCIGGNFYRKGIIYLLGAWNIMLKKLPSIRLIIKGVIPKEFRKLTEGVEIIENRISNVELEALYNEASVLVLPSIDDGFGMVAIEAMSIGLPVILTENVGASDLIKDEGFVIPIRNQQALGEKVIFLYNNPDKLKEMSSKAIEKSKDYTPEKYIQRVVDTYLKI